MAVAVVVPDTLAKYLTLSQARLEAPKWAQDNGAWIKSILDQHDAWLEAAEVEKYQAAYDGYLEGIDLREKGRGDGINNKLQVNYAAIIIDTPVDYLMGKPIVWTVEDTDGQADKKLLEEYRKEITKLLRTEDAQRILSEQLRQGGIAGYSPIISWVDEKGNIDYDEFPVQEVIPVYDVRGRMVLVLRKYMTTVTTAEGTATERMRVEVYDEKYVTFYGANETGDGFSLDEDEALTGNPVEHKAGRIPVSVFINGTPARYEQRLKKAGTSDLGNGVITLLEAYAHAMSDKANYVEYLQDAYLLLTGVDVDQNEVLKMRKARALALKSKESTASFIAQEQEDQAVENHLGRLKDTIHDQTMIPKLHDLQGATATEIKLKYAALDIKAGKKELYFIGAIKQLVKVLTDLLNARRLTLAGAMDPYAVLTGEMKPPASVPLYNADWLQPTINRNLPQNFLEIATIVKTLAGVVPDSYLIELLWFVEDPVAALKELKAQKDEEAKRGLTSMGFGGEFGNTGKDGNTGDDGGEE